MSVLYEMLFVSFRAERGIAFSVYESNASIEIPRSLRSLGMTFREVLNETIMPRGKINGQGACEANYARSSRSPSARIRVSKHCCSTESTIRLSTVYGLEHATRKPTNCNLRPATANRATYPQLIHTTSSVIRFDIHNYRCYDSMRRRSLTIPERPPEFYRVVVLFFTLKI